MNTPAIGPLIPLLMVYDMRRAVAWYRDVLGFEVEHQWEPDGHLYWAQLKHGETRLMLNAEYEDEHRRPEHDRPHGRDVTFYFYPPDVAALRDAVVKRGGQQVNWARRIMVTCSSTSGTPMATSCASASRRAPVTARRE